jgi:hypothetical protein
MFHRKIHTIDKAAIGMVGNIPKLIGLAVRPAMLLQGRKPPKAVDIASLDWEQ